MSSVVRDRDELERKIEEAGEKLIVIDFFANWCGPCKIISPKLEELAKQYAEEAAVLKVNVDDCEDIASDFNITSMPTFIFMRNKSVVDTFVGGNTEKLIQNMQKYVGSSQEEQKKITESHADDEQSPDKDLENISGFTPPPPPPPPPASAPTTSTKPDIKKALSQKSLTNITDDEILDEVTPNAVLEPGVSTGSLERADNANAATPTNQ